MSRWDERFIQHPAHDALASADKEHSAAHSRAQESGELVVQDHERIGHLLRRLQKEFEATDPIAATEAQLKSIQNGLTKKIADSEQTASRVWQVLTVVSFIGFVVLMLFLVPSPADGDFQWPIFIQRTLAALGLGGLAAYSGKQAAKHGERERHNRRLELEIASVGPFLAQLPKDEQDAVIKEIADRTFGRGTYPLPAEESPTTTNGLIELLRMAFAELTRRQ